MYRFTTVTACTEMLAIKTGGSYLTLTLPPGPPRQ